jgi:hypothetical protein
MKRLLIPSAKVVPKELQNLGKLPAIVYPINQEIVFDYLLKQYNDNCSSIDVICYEQAEEVHHRLKFYNSNKITIKDLQELKDLGHTIYFGLENVEEEIIINFADTIVDDNIFEQEGDCFFYSEDYMSETWTFFREDKGIITEIYDKEDIDKNNVNQIKEKLFVGVFKIVNTLDFKRCLEKAFDEQKERISTFYRALQMYSELHPMKSIKTDKWFDIGHLDKYYNSKLEVKSREFNHITIDKNRGILTKTSDNKDKFIGEIAWYLKLPSDLEYSRPRIFSYSLSYEKPYVAMEYYSYHTIHEFFLYGNLSYQQWTDVFKRVKFICDDYKRYKKKDKNIKNSLEDMYLTKTIDRLSKLKNNNNFSSFFKQSITINGVKYKSLDEICDLLKKAIPEMLYNVDEFSIIHGDLCFANIMIDSNLSFIKVIDPRGKFGDYDIYGDFRYELAKLFHSVDGCYDYIIKDLFSINVEEDNAKINFEISNSNREFNLYQLFLDVFKEEVGENLKEIEMIEALLFLSMIPLHGESLNHQYAMLSVGIQILDRVLDIRVDKERNEK